MMNQLLINDDIQSLRVTISYLRFLHKDLMKVTNTFVNVMEHRKEVFYLGSVLVFLFSVLFVLLGQFSSFVGVVKS